MTEYRQMPRFFLSFFQLLLTRFLFWSYSELNREYLEQMNKV